MAIKKYYYGGYAAVGSAMQQNITNRPVKKQVQESKKPVYGDSRQYLDKDWDGESLGQVYIGNKGWVGITPSGRVGYKTSNGYVPIKNLTNYDKQQISLAVNKTGVKAITGDRSREVANAWGRNSKTWLATTKPSVKPNLQTTQKVVKPQVTQSAKPSTNQKPQVTQKAAVSQQIKPNVDQKPITQKVSQAKPTGVLKPQPRINNSAEGQRIMTWQKRLGVKADGWWGKDTTAAYNTWKSKQQQPTANLNTPTSTPTSTLNTQTTDIFNSPHIVPTADLNTPTSEEISSIKTPAPVTLDRSQTRDWLRNRNINPYSLVGSERSALRQYINGDTTGSRYDINLVKNLNSKYNLGFKFKQGGQMYKYQQGGQAQQASGQQGVEQQAIALVQAAMQGDQKATQTIQQIMQAAQQGDQQALQVAQLLQAVMQKMKGSRKARLGAKLNYLNKSIGDCPEGQEVVYFKKGGELCKACQKMQNGGNPIEEFKRRKQKR